MTILDSQPRSIQVVLDEVTSKLVDVDVQQAATPPDVDVGDTHLHAATGHGHGPSTAVNRVVSARVIVPLDPEGIDVDRAFEARPVDDAGDVVAGVELDPRSVHVTIPLFTNRETRTLPVSPNVTGTPAQGFRIASIESRPARSCPSRAMPTSSPS